MTNSQCQEQTLNFLLEVFQAICNSRTETDCKEAVYPLLKANLDKLNEKLAQFLRSKAIIYISEEKPNVAVVSMTTVIFSNLIMEFPITIGYFKWEIAIAGYESVLRDSHKDFTKYDLAVVMNSLASAYTRRVRGDKAKNIELAISWTELALQVLTFDTYPIEWARLQNTLANAYLYRSAGKEIENLGLAITLYEKALKVCTREAFPEVWGKVQNGLGIAYLKCISCGERVEREGNRIRAIAHLQNALQVRTRENFPEDWATTQHNLGVAYIIHSHRVRAENYEQAITHLQNALQVRTRENFPEDWANTQHNLGVAYADRVCGERVQNLNQAINCYQKALLVRTLNNFPVEHVETLSNLGKVYQFNKKLDDAYVTFETAIKTVDFVHENIIYGDNSKQDFLVKYAKLYRSMVEVCLELANFNPRYYTKVVEYVERSKARNLADRLASSKSYSQNRINVNEKFSSLSFSDIQALLPDERTVILGWYVLDTTFLSFIITSKSQYPYIWPTLQEQQQADLGALVDWVGEHLVTHYERQTKWQEQLVSSLNCLAKLLHIERILPLIPESYDRLILIPHSLMHLLPFHALTLPDGSCLLDRFNRGVSYVPSCQLLQLTAENSKKLCVKNFSNFFAIQNPTNDLFYTNFEVATISSYFDSAKVLSSHNATKIALNQEANTGQLSLASYIHFSCHGTFNFASPLESALVLADVSLTLEEIFEFDLSQCRLVTLSACETGLIDFTNLNDEYIGLSSGFLAAGSPSVVSSLWTVNDLSTACLMIKFYQNLQDFQSYSTVALALNKAQLWLRDATKKDIYEWINDLSDPASRRELLKWIRPIKAESKPFESPYYWAAFCAIGQ